MVCFRRCFVQVGPRFSVTAGQLLRPCSDEGRGDRRGSVVSHEARREFLSSSINRPMAARSSALKSPSSASSTRAEFVPIVRSGNRVPHLTNMLEWGTVRQRQPPAIFLLHKDALCFRAAPNNCHVQYIVIVCGNPSRHLSENAVLGNRTIPSLLRDAAARSCVDQRWSDSDESGRKAPLPVLRRNHSPG